MEFERKALSKALADVKAGVSSRLGIPALTGVLIEAGGDGTARLTRTDLELTATAEIPATGGGRFLVPFAEFAAAVKAGAGERVTVEADAETVKIDGGSFRLLPVEDFPDTASTAQDLGAFDAVEFAEAAATVLPATSGDEARPVLTGVLIEAEPAGTRFVATDSYRLHIAEQPGARVASWSGIVPARAVKYVAGRLGRKPSGSVRVFLGESCVSFRFAGSTAGAIKPALALTVRLIEGEFPNYRQLIPERRRDTGEGLTFRYSLPAFLALLKAARPYCSEGARGGSSVSPLRVEFRLPTRAMGPGGVFLSASRPDVGSWSAELTGALFEGEPLTVAFNVDYLAAALTAAGEGAEIELRDGLKPLLAFDAAGRRTVLLMPVRLPAPVVEREPARVAEPVEPVAEVEDQDQDEPVEVEDEPPAEVEDEPVERDRAPLGEEWARCQHGYGPGDCHEPDCGNVAPVAAEIAGAWDGYLAERGASAYVTARYDQALPAPPVEDGPALPAPPAEIAGVPVVSLPPPPDDIAAGGAW